MNKCVTVNSKISMVENFVFKKRNYIYLFVLDGNCGDKDLM